MSVISGPARQRCVRRAAVRIERTVQRKARDLSQVEHVARVQRPVRNGQAREVVDREISQRMRNGRAP
jgi:hypothetical protein